jgi:SAM-dependent methyltransferase
MRSVQSIVRTYIPPRVRLAVRRRQKLPVNPPVGQVRFGDLRRLTPIATDFGYDRGGPVDRYYIEHFLDAHHTDVRGRVLEIGDDTYTRRFGGDQVLQADVLHVDPDAPGATFVGDLADGSFLPSNAFDCVILTQTLQLVFDFAAALRTVKRVLRPGGVLLMTVPGITNIDGGEWGSTWHYSFTRHSVARMCAECFANAEPVVTSYGNVLAAIAFLHGLGVDELTRDERDYQHYEYSLIHGVRVARDAFSIADGSPPPTDPSSPSVLGETS